MKKIIFLGFGFVLFLQAQAQDKITKAGIVGNWSITAAEMTGIFYYNLEKDSLALGDMLKAQVTDPAQLSSVAGIMKPQLSLFRKMFFVFNADGTAELGKDTEAAEMVTYTVDEVNSTITTIDKDKKEETFKADMLKEQLRLWLKRPQGEILLMLRKAK